MNRLSHRNKFTLNSLLWQPRIYSSKHRNGFHSACREITIAALCVRVEYNSSSRTRGARGSCQSDSMEILKPFLPRPPPLGKPSAGSA